MVQWQKRGESQQGGSAASTGTLLDPVFHGTMDCYSPNHLVTKCPFFHRHYTLQRYDLVPPASH
jgi:hypothetical protein